MFSGLKISPKCVCDPAGGAHSDTQTPSWIRGGEGKGRREGEGGEGRKGEMNGGKGITPNQKPEYDPAAIYGTVTPHMA